MPVIFGMGKRITIVLDDDIGRKLRLLQAKAIQNSTSSVSFSSIMNEILAKGLKAK
jgi:hypothetical protein